MSHGWVWRENDFMYLVCKIRGNSNFLRKSKTVISVKIQNFSKSWITKRTLSLESSHEI